MILRVLCLLGFSSAAAFAQSSATPATFYVSTTGTTAPASATTSWATSTSDLQGAIDASQPGDQIWVANGTYRPTLLTGPASRTISFSMKNGVALYGGFVGSETALGQRPTLNLTTPSGTTLSGDIGVLGDVSDNSFHVIKNAAGLTSLALLDGFVIMGGNANERASNQPPLTPESQGGGIFNQALGAWQVCSPTLINCWFVGNLGTEGGAMFNDGNGGITSPALTNCVFQSNSATIGAAIFHRTTAAQGLNQSGLTNCVFESNSATVAGAIYHLAGAGGQCTPSYVNCLIQNNSSTNVGGAVVHSGSGQGRSSPSFTGCSFLANTSGDAGGVFYNLAQAGGIVRPTLTNCLLRGNRSATQSGVMYSVSGSTNTSDVSPVLTNCTLHSNTAASGGRAISNFATDGARCAVTINNGVVFGNGGNSTFLNQAFTGGASSVSVASSLLENTIQSDFVSGPGNLTVNALPFLSATDSRLVPCSIGINAGSNATYTGVSSTTADLAGNARVFGPAIDMGAFELQTPHFAVSITATPSLTLAFEQPAVLTAGGATSYTWSAGNQTSTSINILLATTTVFSVTGITAFCRGVTSTTVTVIPPACFLVLHVTQTGGGLQDGSSWANAFGRQDLNRAIRIAGSCGGVRQVWVAQGVYTPRNPDGTVAQGSAFSLRNNVAVIGGFLGSETALSERPAINLTTPSSTTLSGDIDNDGTLAGNLFRVINNVPVSGSLINNSAVLDGFVITGGNAVGTGAASFGAGIFNSNASSPTIRNCLFQGNNAAAGGGAIFNQAFNPSTPVITNCVFLNNTATNGAAIFNSYTTSVSSSGTVINCIFQNNLASNRGGAIFNDGRVPGRCNPVLTNCAFVNNTAVVSGGAVFNDGTGTTSGTGIQGSNPAFRNCSFLGNSAPTGGAISSSGTTGRSQPTVLNSVFFGNGGATTFANTNATVTAGFSLFEPTAVPTAGLSLTGIGNLTTSVSPFSSSTSAQLNSCALAINAGDPTTSSATVGNTDAAGQARFFANGPIDMGAFEFGALRDQLGILAQPAARSLVCAGSTVTVPISVSGGVLAYEWFRNGQSLGGAQSSSALTLTNVSSSDGGSYSVVVTGRCDSVTSAAFSLTVNTVTVTISLPVNATITCTNPVLSLSVTANDPLGPTSFSVSGPVGFTQTAGGFDVAQPGTYTVLARGSVQPGCAAVTSVSITQTTDVPAISSFGAGQTLTCAQTSATLTAVATGSSSVSYVFGGGGLLSQNPTAGTAVVNAGGIYSVTVTNTITGCSSVTTTTVESNTTAPTAGLVASGSITCANTRVTLTASGGGGLPGVGYAFAGTGIVASGGSSATVNGAGTFSVVVTGANGCTSTTSVGVDLRVNPITASLTSSGTITCATPFANLSATGGNLYTFAGPSVVTQNTN
ncbi:MAG: hypothetical protein EAZ91_00240, partial [Cytophagales bacterium]